MVKKERGFCLVSQQIREKIIRGDITTPENLSIDKSNKFIDKGLENRIQPTSFDPTVGNSIIILDTEQNSVFNPGSRKTVREALNELPRLQAVEYPSKNFLLQIGYSYLIPLLNKAKVQKGESIRASPKSSIGRLFPRTRLISDFNSSFDSIQYNGYTDLRELWLLVQPTAFNLIINPGDKLNQLRFFDGLDVSLSQEELIKLNSRTPLLYKDLEKKIFYENPVITDDGLEVNIDLTASNSNGIIALRARKNPTPIALNKINQYNAEMFFEPVKAEKGFVKLHSGERYLMVSEGILKMPLGYSSEIRRHHGGGPNGYWHEAGFIDPLFIGTPVAEVTLDETGGMNFSVEDRIPLSTIEFFRTNQKPDKAYGPKIGSHYSGQSGPRVSKHFLNFDFARAVRDYKKLDREVLVLDSDKLRKYRTISEGFEPISKNKAENLINEIYSRNLFHSRYDCEEDERNLQIIPYILLFDNRDRLFTYVRAKNIEDYGDERLFGKFSIGVGGHIIKEDAPAYIKTCIDRELKEEVKIKGKIKDIKLTGTLFTIEKPVDRVHFGLIYAAHVNGKIKANESSITSYGMNNFSQLEKISDRFETWSRILIPHLDNISRI